MIRYHDQAERVGTFKRGDRRLCLITGAIRIRPVTPVSLQADQAKGLQEEKGCCQGTLPKGKKLSAVHKLECRGKYN